MKHFLLDIEGTTAPISFVHEVLFPYAKKRLDSFLKTYSWPEDLFSLIEQEFTKDKKGKDVKFSDLFPASVSLTKENVSSYFSYLISVDRKFGPLKEIQGKIWKEGYESSEIQSTIYPDVVDFLKQAKEKGILCHVYSSGSVEAQILIYRYSNFGDLTGYFSSYFDTSVGGKREVGSYQNILQTLGASAEEVSFFTDIVEEAEAANSAGIRSFILDRPGNLPQRQHSFSVMQKLEITSL